MTSPSTLPWPLYLDFIHRTHLKWYRHVGLSDHLPCTCLYNLTHIITLFIHPCEGRQHIPPRCCVRLQDVTTEKAITSIEKNSSPLVELEIKASASVSQGLIPIPALAMLDGLQATGGNICKYLPSTKDVTVHNVHNTFICQHQNIPSAWCNGHMMNIHISSAITALFQFLKEKNIQINMSYQIT
jgi:hypothetical protein